MLFFFLFFYLFNIVQHISVFGHRIMSNLQKKIDFILRVSTHDYFLFGKLTLTVLPLRQSKFIQDNLKLIK